MKLALALAACVATACASTAGGAGEGPARMVKAQELPAKEREALEAWRAGGDAWERERAKVRGDPELERFLVDNLVVQMVRSFDRSAIGSAVHPESPFTRAQAELVRMPSAAVPVLVELIVVGDDIVAFLAADTLERIGTAAVDPVASKLENPGVEVRRRIAELLEKLPPSDSGEPALLERLGRRVEKDDAWIVRAQAARTLGVRAGRLGAGGSAAEVLSRALSDADPEVQKTALQALERLGDSSAVPVLIRRLERAAREGDLAALAKSQHALKRLTGETKDLDPEEWWARWNARGAAPSPAPR